MGVVKPAMSDALWEATRTEVMGSNVVFQPKPPQPANYELYQVDKESALRSLYTTCMVWRVVQDLHIWGP